MVIISYYMDVYFLVTHKLSFFLEKYTAGHSYIQKESYMCRPLHYHETVEGNLFQVQTFAKPMSYIYFFFFRSL